MIRSSILLTATVIALGAVACGDGNEGSKASASAPAASAPKSAKPVASTAPPSTGTAPQADTNDIATEADFEDEAENDITPENVDAELAKIEKELEAK